MRKGAQTTLRDDTLLQVDVSELLRNPGTTKSASTRAGLEGLALPLAKVQEDTELALELRLEALVDGIHVTGTVTGKVVLECRRCLRDFTETLKVGTSGVFLYPGNEGRDDDSFDIVDERIDLEPMIRNDVMLALPLHPLCREDCKGLCPECGADRNETDCGHSSERSDLRWSALEQLRRRMED